MVTHINEIIRNFDFNRVHVAMMAVGWRWIKNGGDNGTPTVFEMKEQAKQLLRYAIDLEPNESTGTGGLWAHKRRDEDGVFLELEFVFARGTSQHLNIKS